MITNEILSLNKKILTKISPFTQNSVNKDSEIRGFVGRVNQLAQLISFIRRTAFSREGVAIKITGPGGSGKSALFRYLCILIETNEIFTNPDYNLNSNEIKIIPAFIDAPKGQMTNFRYFWTSIIDSLQDSLGENSGEFFEYFGVRLFLECLRVLYLHKEEDSVIEIMEEIIPDFQNQITKYPWEKIITPDYIQNENIFVKPEILLKITRLIKNNGRNLNKSQKTLSDGRKCKFKYEGKFLNELFNVFSEDLDAAEFSLGRLKGLDSEFLKNDSDIMKLLNWINNSMEWISGKPVCFVVGVDNLGYLTVDLPEGQSPYPSFIQTLLDMRDHLHNFLFIIIGTTDDWESMNNYIQAEKKNYEQQLIGFISHTIDLARLDRREALKALRFLMQIFWANCKQSPENINYPFSSKFFNYLYDFRLKDFRRVLNDLNSIWDNFRILNDVRTFDDSWKIIRFIRQGWQESAYMESFSPRNMLPFEKWALKEKWDKIISPFASKDRSKMVEKELTRFLNVIRENERPRKIAIVQNAPKIKISKGDKVQYRSPDVFVQLINSGTIDDRRSFEIQVKIHSDSTLVSQNEIEGSLDSLAHNKIDALLFLMTGPGLDSKAIESIHQLGLTERIFSTNPLNQEQMNSLLFMVFYYDLFQEDPDIEIVLQIINDLFNQTWESLLNRIQTISPLTDSSIKIIPKVLIDIPSSSPLASPTPKTDLSQKTISSTNIKKKAAFNNLTTSSKSLEKPGISEKVKISDLEKVTIRYNLLKAEIMLIFRLALTRTGRFSGRVTKD